MTILLPGDPLPSPPPEGSKISLGPGLLLTKAGIITSSKAGFLKTPSENQFYIQDIGKKYIAMNQDPVIGQIISKSADFYKVDIGAPTHATLNLLMFNGATKRNAPNLAPGSFIYAKVSLAAKDMEPELECLGEGYGPLEEQAYVVSTNLYTSRQLLDDDHPAWALMSARRKFQVAVGVNGRVWVSSNETSHIADVARCLSLVGLQGWQSKIKKMLK